MLLLRRDDIKYIKFSFLTNTKPISDMSASQPMENSTRQLHGFFTAKLLRFHEVKLGDNLLALFPRSKKNKFLMSNFETKRCRIC